MGVGWCVHERQRENRRCLCMCASTSFLVRARSFSHKINDQCWNVQVDVVASTNRAHASNVTYCCHHGAPLMGSVVKWQRLTESLVNLRYVYLGFLQICLAAWKWMHTFKRDKPESRKPWQKWWNNHAWSSCSRSCYAQKNKSQIWHQTILFNNWRLCGFWNLQQKI